MEPEIARLRAARLEREVAWRVQQDRKTAIRQAQQHELIQQFGGPA